MSALPKPVLRGHVKRLGIRTVIGAVLASLTCSSSYFFFFVVPRRKAHVEFLKNYDPQAHFNDLLKWGYIQTVPRGGE